MDKSESGSARLEQRILVAYYASLALLTAGAFLGSGRVWGFNWWSYLPVWVWLLIFLGSAFVPIVVRRISPSSGRPQSSLVGLIWTVAGLIGAVSIFYLCANRTHFLGDGLQILHNLRTSTSTHMFWNVPAEWIQEQVFGFIGGNTEVEAKLAIQLISWGSGALTIGSLLWAGRMLGLGPVDNWLFCLVVLTSGIGMLFFGYVETYPPFIFAVTLTCLLGTLAADGKISRWWAVITCLISIALHLFAVTLLPAVIYLVLRPTSFWQRLLRLPTFVRYGFPAMLMVAGIFAVGYWAMHDYQIRFMLVPSLPDRFTVDGYTLFSFSHLLDMVNLKFLLIPAAALVAVEVWRHRRVVTRSDRYRFLFAAAIAGVGLVFVFDPKLGMLRDWDLFAYASVPVVLFWSLFCLAPSHVTRAGRALAILTIALNLVVLAPRVAVAMSPDRSMRMVEQIFRLERAKAKSLHFLTVDYLRSNGYKARGDSLANSILTRYPEINLHEQAVTLYDKGRARESIVLDSLALSINPAYYDPYTSMCAAYVSLNQLDKALEVGEIVFGLNPRNPGIAYNLGNINAHLSRLKASERYLKIALDLDSAYEPALFGMATLAVANGEPVELQRWLARLPVNGKVDSSRFADLVRWACMRKRFDYAADLLRFGLQYRFDSAAVTQFLRKYPQIQQGKRN